MKHEIRKVKNSQIIVQDTVVTLTRVNESDFISLTDIARVRNADEPKDVVKNWLRTRSTIEFLGLWEKINNPAFKGVEFDSFKNEAGSNSFTLSPTKWIDVTAAIGSLNAELIRKEINQTDRLKALNATAILQMRSLLSAPAIKRLTK